MESAKRYFAEQSISKIPNYKTLQSEIEHLTSQQNELCGELKEKRNEVKRLKTVADNISKTLHLNQEKIKLHDKNELQE